VTANVNLWPQMDVLLAHPGRLAALTRQQRGWLQQAAHDAAAGSTALADHDAQLLTSLCQSGARFANASKADLVALRTAFAPVYATLEQDPQTNGFIQRIQALKQSTPPGAPLAIPAGCTGAAPTRPGAAQGSAAGRQVSGIYRWTLTKQDARARAPQGEDLSQYPQVVTMTLKDRNWQLGVDNFYSGTYAVSGNRIVFDWPAANTVLTFTFSIEGKGNLHLTPVAPMDKGDQFVWSTKVWAKIG
jgi:hypothetical protein